MKIDRLLAMTILLLNRRRISAGELAERFEVSTKTVYRDIETLCRAGIPIVSHQGMSGGFELMERYTIGRQMLSSGEIEALRAAVKGAATVLDDDRTFGDLTEKVQALLGGGNGGAGEPGGPGVVFDFNPWNCSASMRHRIELLRSAARESLRVEVRYLNMNGRESRRALEPAMLLMRGGIWYLQAYCLLRGEFRIFRLSRMLELRGTGEPFLPKPAPPIDSYEWQDDGDKTTPIEVSLRFRPEVRLRVIDQFDSSRLSELGDGGVRVSGLFVADEWFYGMLLSYGDRVSVEFPQEAADELLRRARQIVDAYAGRAKTPAGTAESS